MTPAYGWLVRADLDAGTLQEHLGPGATRAEHAHVTVLVEGDADAAAVARTVAEHGLSTLESPPGAAAIAVWDARERALGLARDRVGTAPLFRSRSGKTVTAACDLQALLRSGVSREPSPIALAEWVWSRPTVPEETPFVAVRRVPAATVVVERDTGTSRRRTWLPPPSGSFPSESAAERYRDALLRATRRLTAGQTMAVFLSGGLDSGSVAVAAALVSRTDGLPPPLALCMLFPSDSEEATQRAVAGALGMPVSFRTVDADKSMTDQALKQGRHLLWPRYSPWLPVGNALTSLAREAGVGVTLAGIGGDEVLDVGVIGVDALARRLRVRALVDRYRAERWYRDQTRSGAVRSILGAGIRVRLRPRRPEPIPDWLAVDPILRRALGERRPATLTTPEAIREDDLDNVMFACALENAYHGAASDGIRTLYPIWSPEVLEAMAGLAPEALLIGSQAKGPARALLAAEVAAVQRRWPQPAVADVEFERAIVRTERGLWESLGGPRLLAELGVIRPRITQSRVPLFDQWCIMALEMWLRLAIEGEI